MVFFLPLATGRLLTAADVLEAKPRPGQFPNAAPLAAPITIAEILRGRQIVQVQVLSERARMFGPVDLHVELTQMLSLLSKVESVSVTDGQLAAEDSGPAIRVGLNTGAEIIVRRIHFRSYRLYWEGKTAWFHTEPSPPGQPPPNSR